MPQVTAFAPARALALAALLAAACGGGSGLRLEPEADLQRYRRVGVLPFTDRLGEGRRFADALSRGLWRLGFDFVDAAQLEAVFSSLKIEPGSGLSLQDLAEIRRATFADALIFGAVDSAPDAGEVREAGAGRRKGISLIMLDAVTGDVVLRASLRSAGAEGRPEAAAREVVEAFGRELRQRGIGWRRGEERP